MFSSVYVKRHILNKDIFHLWDCPEDPWMQMNEEKLGLLWRDLLSSPPGRILQVFFEAVLNSKSYSGLVHNLTQVLLELMMKQEEIICVSHTT